MINYINSQCTTDQGQDVMLTRGVTVQLQVGKPKDDKMNWCKIVQFYHNIKD
jgi:hypothetical protein